MAASKAVRQAALPAELSVALRGNAEARAAFEALSPSHRREYVKWITEAKKAETRQRRTEAAVVRMVENNKEEARGCRRE
ncbi:MAG TPA: YdeI/OmpD-associated family protein [Phycisphaerae bacterium]|nr:YdeI/OmpD-associated family protein [Phycisphaerae bacterium]